MAFVLFCILTLSNVIIFEESFAEFTPTEFIDDPTSCDTLFGPPISDEIGEGTVGLSPLGPFPPSEELDVISETFAELGTCPSFNGAALDFVIEIKNLSGESWEHVVYVTDFGLGIGGYDGFVNGETAVEIDTFGVNVNLLSESIIADNIWQPLEVWEFVLQDFGASGPFTLDSIGIAAASPTSSPSTGSIIVWNEKLASTSGSQATGTTTILGTCGLSFPDGNSVNYGALLPNTISNEIALNMTNSGSVSALLEIRGTDWLDGSNNSVMNVNQTHFNQTAFQNTFAQKALLNATDGTVTNSFVPSELVKLALQLEAVLLDPFFTGSATQTMDFTVSC